ncbi:MAG TPA: hypothetical protein VEW95_05455 [Candidatus Limnocylindrales bacterium]|nr:hypothetical protein [Candidatus Limnocylindrales bacterium]
MAKKREYVPILNVLEVLLQGHPTEFMDVAHGDQPESDRAAMQRAAHNWIRNPILTVEEVTRIQRVWVDGEYLPALNVPRVRREELRAIVVPRRDPHEPRPTAEQLQAAIGGGG